ncbi:MarR family winged helix-turn-helix transcriptional regulator [Nonomuraea sp. NPDC050540]|uniref:MarR family winged helix-turn-helix transcriptional regulator n=1 Tax=Nonomuraea sp. NPDC050540 TaxID=3364367 RepID=UPI00379F50FC
MTRRGQAGDDRMEERAREAAMAQHTRLAEELRAYGASFNELGRRFADRLGIHLTDAFALMEIAKAESAGAPLSPAQLGKRVALSSGAMTALVNRLEEHGYVSRVREHADRRVVTLYARARAKELAEEFFGPIVQRQEQLLGRYTQEQLHHVETFLAGMRAAMDEQLG